MATKFSLSKTETKIVNKHTVRRIIYADGTKGGWLEREDNLIDDARVDDEACVFGAVPSKPSALYPDIPGTHPGVLGTNKASESSFGSVDTATKEHNGLKSE